MIPLAALAALTAAAPAVAQTACLDRQEVAASARRAELSAGRWSPEVRARLEQLIERRGAKSGRWDPCHRPLAALALDRTIVAGDLGARGLDLGLSNGFVKLSTATRAALNLETATALAASLMESPTSARFFGLGAYREVEETRGSTLAAAWRAQLFGGRTTLELEALALDLFDRELLTPLEQEVLRFGGKARAIERGLALRPEMTALIRALVDSGFDVVVISSAPEWLLRALAPRVGLPRQSLLGTRTVESLDGRQSSLSVPPAASGMGKVAALRSRVAPGGRRPVLVVGGSKEDAELLAEGTDLAVLFDSEQASLKTRAQARGWAIQPTFERAPKDAPYPTHRR